jgi:hypothetical protein
MLLCVQLSIENHGVRLQKSQKKMEREGSDQNFETEPVSVDLSTVLSAKLKQSSTKFNELEHWAD